MLGCRERGLRWRVEAELQLHVPADHDATFLSYGAVKIWIVGLVFVWAVCFACACVCMCMCTAFASRFMCCINYQTPCLLKLKWLVLLDLSEAAY